MKEKGSITIYLSLIFVCISALICGLVESARTAGLRFYARVYANSSIDSLFSEYHNDLWDTYRLILLECKDVSAAKKHIEGYIEPYAKADNWFAMSDISAEILRYDAITDEGGAWFENEILDYMKYAALNLGYDGGSAELLKEQVEEAQSMKEITDDYGGHTRQAAGVEKSLARISEQLDEMTKLYQEAGTRLNAHDGSVFRKKANEIIKKAKKIPSMVDSYVKKADKLKSELEKTKESHDEDWDKLKDDSKELLSSDLNSYDTYISEDGDRRREIVALKSQMDTLIDEIDSVIEHSIDVEDEIASADEEDDIDEGALWQEVYDEWNDIDIPRLECAKGLTDEEKENTLERVLDMLSGDIYSMVIPADRSVSKKDIKNIKNSLPSSSAVTDRNKEDIDLLDKLLVTEYISRFTYDFVENKEGVLDYQLEYIISGKDEDSENLYSTLNKILAIREGLNYLYILSNPQMRSAVSALATAIAAAVCIPGLNLMLEYMIIGAWSLAESVMDLKALLSGKKVPLYKDSESWQLDLEGVLSIASSGISDDTKDSQNGVSYEAYLKFLTFLLDSKNRNYRAMDIIQAAIGSSEEGFLMKNCIYAMDVSITSEASHLFTNLSISNNEFLGLSKTFTIKTEVSKAY